MRPFLVALLACAAGLVLVPHARAGACGLPDAQPLWIEYGEGTVSFRKVIFGHPGIVVASSELPVAAELRSGGAQSAYWEMHLNKLAGTTANPADPAVVDSAADKLFDKAVRTTGCQTPVIALNELAGPGTTTPWTPNNATYRADVLEALRHLAARGAHPYLLVPGPAPYTGGDAAFWWQQAAQVADLVPEVYFPAPSIYDQGPVIGSRALRRAFRAAIGNFAVIGIPASRLGVMLGFQSDRGVGGREGLQPARAWLEIVKLQALAARQVAAELGLATVWSWGWGTFGPASADGDKPAAACVYLWTRDQNLCNGPGAAGAGFDESLTEGQIDLPDGAVCRIGETPIAAADVDALAAVTGDREVAFSALLERAVEAVEAPVPDARVLDAEKTVILLRFGGNRKAYLAALARAHATLAVARGVLADELRRAQVQTKLRIQPPASSEVDAFYVEYPQALAREFQATPGPRWLGGQARGFVLQTVAPTGIFSLRTGRVATVRTVEGSFQVRALGEPFSVGALPLPLARGAIQDALASFARRVAFEAWSVSRQNAALDLTVCRGDDLPAAGTVALSSYLPYLRLNL